MTSHPTCVMTRLSSLSRTFASLKIVLFRSKMPFYAVARGHKPGIYESWPECQKTIAGFSGARYKKFATETEAKEFIQENAASCPVVDRRTTNDKPSEKAKTDTDSEAKEGGGASSHSSRGDGRMSPTLMKMKQEMKRLQKELSELRGRFDEYVAGNSRGSDTHPPAAEKRKHEEEEQEEDGPSSAKKLNTGGDDDKSKFSTDSDGFLIVYTDGACEFNGKHGAKAGVGVYFGPDHPLNVSEPVKGRATNNTAEIQAATYALELAQASGFSKVAVHTDSQFMINCMTSWLKNWKKKGWVKSDGEPVKNKEDLITLDKASDGLAVKWVHVKGHAGHVGNEEADRLARKGSKLYKSEV